MVSRTTRDDLRGTSCERRSSAPICSHCTARARQGGMTSHPLRGPRAHRRRARRPPNPRSWRCLSIAGPPQPHATAGSASPAPRQRARARRAAILRKVTISHSEGFRYGTALAARRTKAAVNSTAREHRVGNGQALGVPEQPDVHAEQQADAGRESGHGAGRQQRRPPEGMMATAKTMHAMACTRKSGPMTPMSF
jgi:hypothetical protein